MRLVEQLGEDTREWVVRARTSPLLARRRIVRIGVSDAAHGLEFSRPNPQFSRVLACFSGRGEVLVDGAWRPCEPGCAYLTPASSPHGHRAVRGSRWGIAWIVYHRRAPRHVAIDGPPRLVDADPEPLRLAALGLHREMLGVDPGPLAPHWLDLAHACAQRIARTSSDRAGLWRLWSEIAADPQHDWTLAEMAELAGVSPEQLRRRCLAEHGQAPMHRATLLKMRHAAGLLDAGDSVASVAEAVGYRSRFAFSTAFKRCLGRSPSAHRRSRG
jgi:AraC-like DNA-binding protein